MWRFKVSKFKNAAPKQLKKDEYCSDIPVGNLMSSNGNYVAASCKHVAFNVELGGSGKVGVLQLDEKGRKDASMPVIFAHSDFVSDMAFSPFHDDLLFTGSFDATVKMWKIPDGGLKENLSEPIASLPSLERRVENIACHPSADNIIAVSVLDKVSIYDVNTEFVEKRSISNESGKPLQSMDWKSDGTLMITSSKDKMLRVIDPRESSIALVTNGHDGMKDSRSKWLGDSDFILSTGFGMGQNRAVSIWDTRNFSNPQTVLSIDSSTGILMPFYDADTNILFLAGKGDSTIYFYEFTHSDPFLTLALPSSLDSQTVGMGMVPKRAMDVMNGEVNRLIQLGKNSLYPLKYVVPRKSYKDFHSDLFPDTSSGTASMTAENWLSGDNTPMSKVSLDPAKRSDEKQKEPVPEAKEDKAEAEMTQAPKETLAPKTKRVLKIKKSSGEENTKVPETSKATVKTAEPVPPASDVSTSQETSHNTSSAFPAIRVAKFRHLHAEKFHKKHNIENIRNLAESLVGESDGFQGFEDLVALPLAGPGGQIAVFQLSKPGRLPETGIPVLMNGCSILDFAMNPFNNYIIAAACEDGFIRIWHVPKTGLAEILQTPQAVLKGHRSRANIVRYHPTAADLLTSASYDFTVRIWNAASGEELICLDVPEAVLSLAWSPDGIYLAVFCKDGFIRIYNPREGTAAIKECNGPEGIRGGRIVWGGPENKWLIVSGFSRSSSRTLNVYDTDNFDAVLESADLDISPSILMLHYDEDSSTVFATGKGDATVFAFEICQEKPHILELSHCRIGDLHQGLAFLRKDLCDVRKVEFARAARLTKTSIEQVSFFVPRVKDEFFQDDLFPETRVKWEAALSCEDWMKGQNKVQPRKDLKPSDMIPLSKAPKQGQKSKKYESKKELDAYKSTEQKKEELLSSIRGKLDAMEDEPLYQDSVEGVEDDEWGIIRLCQILDHKTDLPFCPADYSPPAILNRTVFDIVRQV